MAASTRVARDHADTDVGARQAAQEAYRRDELAAQPLVAHHRSNIWALRARVWIDRRAAVCCTANEAEKVGLAAPPKPTRACPDTGPV